MQIRDVILKVLEWIVLLWLGGGAVILFIINVLSGEFERDPTVLIVPVGMALICWFVYKTFKKMNKKKKK